MSTIDDRIVQMKFDNKQFQEPVKQTIDSLSELEEKLRLDGVESSVETIASKFSAFGAIAFTALQNLTNSAIGLGQKIAAAILDPLIEGGKKRALNIEQARFQFQGLGMDVEQSMADALYAVKGTAFGLDEAAVAAAQFGASGIQSGEEMQSALRGISGVAAMAGSSYTDMANVFTKVAGQGRLMGDDLNRLGARGINAAATLAEAFGTTETEIRDMVSKGQISFQTFAKVMSDTFGEHATKANDTYTGSLSNMRAALSRIGAAFYTPHFEQQRNIFNALTPAIDNVATALKPMIDLFTEFGRIKMENIVNILDALNFSEIPDQLPPIFQALKNALQFISDIITPIRRAFQDIFPPATAAQIQGIANAILEFTQRIQLSGTTMGHIRSTFKGLFAVLDIGWMILQQVFGVLGRIFSAMMGGSGSVLSVTANFGEFLVKVRDAIKDGTALGKVFKFIGDVLVAPVNLIKRMIDTLSNSTGMKDVTSIWEALGRAIKAVWEFIQPAVQWVVAGFNQVKDAVGEAFRTMDFNVLIGMLNVGAIGAVGFFVKKLVDTLKNGIDVNLSTGLFDSLKEALGQLTSTLSEMQNKLRAEVLLKIAFAVGILAAALIALSMVEPGRLYSALGGLTITFGLLLGSLVALDKFFANAKLLDMAKTLVKVKVLSSAMITLAVAAGILAAAMFLLGHLDWNGIAKGIVGVAAGMGILVGAMVLLDKAKLNPVSLGGLITLASSLLILSFAIEKLGNMSLEDLGKGLLGVAGGVVVMVGGLTLLSQVGPKLGLSGAALLLTAGALVALAAAVEKFGSMDPETIKNGLLAMGFALVELSVALTYMPVTTLAASAAILVASGAMHILAGALAKFGEMQWDEIARGLVAMGGSLAILAGAMALMGVPLVLLGAVGLTAAALAMTMLAPALKLMGGMSWDEIGRGLALLASALGIIAVGGLLLIVALPGLLGLGAAVMLIGAGALMAGQGLLMLSAGLVALAGAGALGAEAIKMALMSLIEMIPAMMAAVAQGIIDFAIVITEGQAEFVGAFTTLIMALLESINTTGPEIIATLFNLLMALVQEIESNVESFVVAGMNIMIGFLNGIEDRLPELVRAATNLIVTFIGEIANNSNQIIEAGADMIIDFVNGLARTIEQKSGEMGRAGGRLATAIIRGMANGIWEGVDEVVSAARGMAERALNSAMEFLGINSPSRKFIEVGASTTEGMALGIKSTSKRVEREAAKMGGRAVYVMQKSISDISKAVASDIDINPVIKPVLDMTDMNQRWKENLSTLPARIQLNTDNPAGKANYISYDRHDMEYQRASTQPEKPATMSLTYNQTINSPKALDSVEVYRRTKSQLSSTKNQLDLIQQGEKSR